MSFRYFLTLQGIANLIPSFICCVCRSEREELQMSNLSTLLVFTVVPLVVFGRFNSHQADVFICTDKQI